MYSTKMENMMIWCKYTLYNNYPNQINCYANHHHTYYRLDSFKRKQVEMQSNTPGLSGLSKELHGNYFISGSERYSVGLLCSSSLQLDCLRKADPIVYSLWNHSGKGKALETVKAFVVDKNCCVVKRDEERKHRRI